jgi:hypothetical protein
VKKGSRSGQVVVEMMLMLPIFFSIVFTIMEIGYVSFHLILLNHATYEVARIGGMSGNASGNVDCGRMGDIMKEIIPTGTVGCDMKETLTDPQSGQLNHDLIITGSNSIKLIFPVSTVILANPKGTGTRRLQAIVRMPIETPLLK